MRMVFQSTRPARGATGSGGQYSRRVYSFNPRAPHGARPTAILIDPARSAFQSTRPARGATPCGPIGPCGPGVSIHAPRTGRDECPSSRLRRAKSFNPRAPHGARRVARCCSLTRMCFNPRAPHGARLTVTGLPTSVTLFQSTRPARGATRGDRDVDRDGSVSIHAPRTGRDVPGRSDRGINAVSIHAPRTGRDQDGRLGDRAPAVSIHAPRTGRDPGDRSGSRRSDVSIHAPRTGRDGGHQILGVRNHVSIHAPRTGRDCNCYKLINPNHLADP